MGLRFKETGSIYKSYVKDKELYVEFAPGIVVHKPLPFVKEDFLIDHVFPCSNVAILLESKTGNILIAWFTGGMSIYRPVGTKWRLMAHTNFNINEFRDSVCDTCENGVIQSGTVIHVTRTYLYPLRTYFPKEYPNISIWDVPDGKCGFVVPIDKNFKAVAEVLAGTSEFPGFLRDNQVLSKIGSDSSPLVGTYIIEQPENGEFTFNL